MDKTTAMPSAGLIAGLATVARNAFGLFVSRMELASLELSEIRNHLQKLALVLVLAILAAWFAIAYGTGLVIYLAWESLGWKILLIMAIGFAILAAGLLLYAWMLLKQNKLSMPATMAEFKTDCDILGKL